MDPNIGLLIDAVLPPTLTLLGSVVGGWVISSQLRRAGLVVDPDSGELDWARLMGLLTALWILLLGLGINGVTAGGLLGDIAGILTGLTMAGALLTGVAHHRLRQLRSAERSERPRIREEQRWLSYGAMAVAALAITGLSISLPMLLLIVGLGGAYIYSRPALRRQLEGVFSSWQAGQQLREDKLLTVGDQLGDVTVAGPVGVTSTPVRDVDGSTRMLANNELLLRVHENDAP